MTDTHANDGFERYFTERLWEMIPETYRHEDGIAENPGVLRAFVELIAEQAVTLRRSEDRLWDDEFAELCDDWVLPYISDLIGARLVGALDQRARRITVAKTIHYRRRAGTMALLEQLAVDITGWDATVVEQFRRIGRARHLIDPVPALLAGRVTRTAPGGWADLRAARGAELAGGPADEYHYTPDMRRHRGMDGRFGIPKLAVHLYRLAYYEMTGVDPYHLGGGKYTFDPAGRDIPLFAPRRREDESGGWQAARSWDLAAPITCLELGDATYRITDGVLVALVAGGLSAAAARDLQRLLGIRIPGETQLRDLVKAVARPANLATLTAPAMQAKIRDASLTSDCGSSVLLAGAVATGAPEPDAAMKVVRTPGGYIPHPSVVAANLSAWPAIALAGKLVAIDPAAGRFKLLAGAPPATISITTDYVYGFSGPIGAGPYDRRDADEGTADQSPSGGGALTATLLPTVAFTTTPTPEPRTALSRIADSRTYGPAADRGGVEKMAVVAANGARPYVKLSAPWLLNTGTKRDSELLLDGLWIGSGSAGNHIVLNGDYETVTIRRCTIDPGSLYPDGTLELPCVELRIAGSVERLIISESILGPIRAVGASGVIESLEITDSIIQSIDPAVAAIEADASNAAIAAGETTLTNITVFGRVSVNRLSASGSIITGLVTVNDRQHGCFRFSAAPAASALPRPYECFLFGSDPTYAFTSRRVGQPGYAQLTAGAPEAMRTGGEDGIEMGALASLGTPAKLEGLAAKLEEFMPFGLVPVFIPQT